MYQRDFILRMIEDFFRFLSIALKLKGNKEYDKALDMIEETAQKLLKINLTDLLADEAGLEKLMVQETYPLEQIEMLAELLKVKAEIHFESGQVFSAISNFEKSLQLFNHCQSQSKNYSIDRVKKIGVISFALDNLRETSPTQ